MSKFAELSPPQIDSLTISVVAPKTLRLNGTISLQEPSRTLGPFLKAVHEAAIKDGVDAVELDLTQLKFVNSSAIRLFLDWASWLKQATGAVYKLRILTTRKFTWQKTSFTAITALAAGHVELKPMD